MERKNTKFKKIIGSALALMVAFVTFLSFDSKVSAVGEFTDPYLYKEIQKTPGVTTPTVTFTYSFEKYSFNGDTTTDGTGVMPAIADSTVAFGSVDNTDNNTTTTGIIEIRKGIVINIPAMSGAGGFTRAGEYVYKITEKSDTFTDTTTAKLTESEAVYEIHIFVKNTGDNLALGGVTAYNLLNDAGSTSGIVPTAKVDGSETGQGILFISKYSKTAPFYVKKEVAGDYADKLKKFSFTINFKASAALTGSNNYAYYLTDASGTKIPSSDGTLTINGTGTLSIQLSHGQSVVFDGLPTGTTYYAIETADAKYTSVGEISSNGTITSNITQKTSGGDLLLNLAATETYDTLIGEDTNYAKVVNTENSISVTGLIFENLPFLILIAVGIGGIGFYVTKRRRHQ